MNNSPTHCATRRGNKAGPIDDGLSINAPALFRVTRGGPQEVLNSKGIEVSLVSAHGSDVALLLGLYSVWTRNNFLQPVREERSNL